MDSEKHIDLGTWAGLQKAFATVAGSCNAARAQCLKQVRDSRILDDLGFTWEEFCREQAGISRAHADNLIRQHEQFGDAYFRLSEIARISPQAYQQIASRVDGETIEIDGEKLALIPANANKIRAAIQALRNRTVPAEPAPRLPAGLVELRIRVDALAEDINKAFRALHPQENWNAHNGLLTYTVNKFRTLARHWETKRQNPDED